MTAARLCVQDAAFGYVNVFKSHVNIGFYNGAFLDDPGHLLNGSGKRMRHVKLMPGVEVKRLALEKLVTDACRDVKVRLQSE